MTADLSDQKILQESKKGDWWQMAMEFFAQIMGWIALPIIAGALLGKWLDHRFGAAPTYFYVCVAAAFVITNVGLILNVIRYAKRMQANIDAEKKEQETRNRPQK